MSVRSLDPVWREWPRGGRERTRLIHWLKQADVEIDGSRLWDIRIHDDRLYRRLWAEGSVGLGDAYVDGWWDCEALDELIYRVLRAGLHQRVRSWADLASTLKAKALNLQTTRRAQEVGRRHYDIGNELYLCMLDRRMIYSCAYWENADTLDAAQEAKLDLVCRKLALEPDMRVLDIGCGWGGAAKFAAERYGVSVVGVTISHEQAEVARQTCRGLPIEIRLEDYRRIRGRFDRIYSIGMFEHVGFKNYRTYMRVVSRCLEPDGLFLLHTIGSNVSDTCGNPWVERHIFPNSMLPSCRQISAAIEGCLMYEDWHRFGQDYDRTLMQWWENFDRHWSGLRSRYDERFYRMWRYYLLSFAGAFRAGHNQLWQIVLSPLASERRYKAVR